METLYTRRNSHFDVNIICVPEYFCHPVHVLKIHPKIQLRVTKVKSIISPTLKRDVVTD